MANPQGLADKSRVLEATDLVRLVGEQLALKRKGREWVGLCPFHEDHNPSMYVVPAKQIYHCFVCGAGGDALSFVMNYFKMGFREALEHLADRAGLTLAPLPPLPRGGGGGWTGDRDGAGGGGGGGGGATVSREGLLAASRAAQEFFRAILGHPEHGRAARELLARRGVSAAMIEQFGLGAAPDRWDGLALTIAGKSLPRDAFVAAGLLKARDGAGAAGGGGWGGGGWGGGAGGGGCYDAFRNRLLFPIHDALGRVVAFGARRLNDADEPKYLNSPESVLFSKSRTLYALPAASASIRAQDCAIVCEGYMDAIACHQAGVTNVVATLGTALTPAGARILRRLCNRVVLLFDGDEAGQRAADRAIEVVFAEPLDVRIAVLSAAQEPGLPVAKDPDELLKQPRGRERFDAMIASAVDALDYRFSRLRQRLAGLGLTARAEPINAELRRLAELGLAGIEPIRRNLIVRRLALLAGVDEATVRAALAQSTRRGPPARPPETRPVAGPVRLTTTADHLLACAVVEPDLLDDLESEQDGAFLTGAGLSDPRLTRLARSLLAGRDGSVDAPTPGAVTPGEGAGGDEDSESSASRQMRETGGARRGHAGTDGGEELEERQERDDSDELSRTRAAVMAAVNERTGSTPEAVGAWWRQCLERHRAEGLARQATDATATVTARLEALRRVEAMGGNRAALPRPRGPI